MMLIFQLVREINHFLIIMQTHYFLNFSEFLYSIANVMFLSRVMRFSILSA